MLGNGLSDGCEVVVADPQLLDDKISAIRTAGPTKLQVIASSLVSVFILHFSFFFYIYHLIFEALDWIV